MKKLIAAVCFGLLTVFCLGAATVAHADGTVSTTIFAPSRYLEFYDLDSPIDFSYSNTTYVICEADKVVTFSDELFKEYDLSDYNVTEIAQYGEKFLLFVSDSKLYTLDLETSQIIDNDIVTNTLALYENRLITNPGNSFVVYELSTSDGYINFTQLVAYSKSVPYRAVAPIDANTWLCVSEGKLYKFISEGGGNLVPIPGNLGDVRYATYADGVYYYSTENGIYAIGLDGTFEQLVAITPIGQEALGCVVNPQGLFESDGLLYICDSGLNAVTCYDLSEKAFTDFAITTRADSDNRVSTQASDFKTDGENLLVLDGGLIKTFFSGGHGASKKIPLSGSYYDFATIGNNYLLSNGTGLYAMEEIDGKLTQKQITADVQNYNDIAAITSYEDSFYFINNTMRSSSPYAEVYKISPSNYGVTEQSFTIMGTGLDLTTDLFGRLYLLCYNDKDYTIHAFNHKENSTEIYRTQSKILSIAVDFECNIYALLSTDQIVRINGETGKTQTFTITKSSNIAANYNAKDILILPASDKAYALYDGFILELDPTALSISTPEHISIPEDFNVDFNIGFRTATVNKGAQIFRVDLMRSDGDEYAFTGYSTYDGSDEFVVLYDDGKYSLIATETLSAIVRTKDLTEKTLTTVEDNNTYYAVSEGFTYGYPVLNEYFRAGTVTTDQVVEIAYTFSLNGTVFALCTADGQQGFLPRSMLKESIATDGSPYEMEIVQIGLKGATVYSDAQMGQMIGKISAYESVKVYEKCDGMLKIEFEDGFGYIEETQISSKGSVVIRNFILISLVVITVAITVIYIYRKFLLNKKETNE